MFDMLAHLDFTYSVVRKPSMSKGMVYMISPHVKVIGKPSDVDVQLELCDFAQVPLQS